jgi:hypothetical protein
MKNTLWTIILILSAQFSIAQINAVTETGDEVLLSADGTWMYKNENKLEDIKIPVNDKLFVKNEKSTFLVKSKKFNIGVWINPKTWNFAKGGDQDAFEFQFQKIGGDLYAMLISEQIEIPIETLKGIAVENARSAAPDIKVTKEEYRTINGTKVLLLQMTGTIQGLKFTYYGYYYSNANGTVQLLTYTGEKLFKSYFADIELFLNGFVVL